MSVKKNLTIATLAALLAIPAFNGIKLSHSLYVPSTTVHADSITKTTMSTTGIRYVVPYGKWEPDNDNGHSVAQQINIPENTSVDVEAHLANGLVVQPSNHIGSFLIPYSAVTTTSNSQNKPTSHLVNTKKSYNSTATQSTANQNNQDTQYASNKELPQTGETNNDAKIASIGVMALASGIGLTALSIAKKHKQMALEENINTKKSINNDNPADSIYHLIMSNAFNNISKHLND